MKKIRIPFDLTEFKKGGYTVETKGFEDGSSIHKVRIICTDKKGRFHIVGVVQMNDEVEDVWTFTGNGIFNNITECNLMLVKTEYENGDVVKDCRKDKIFIVKGNAGESHIYDYESSTHNTLYCRPATEGEQKQLFEALEKEGKRWNSEKKCLEDVKKEEQFKPMQWCLMRYDEDTNWDLCQYAYSLNMSAGSKIYVAVGGLCFEYCIPYNDKTKHLLGTNQDYKESEETK